MSQKINWNAESKEREGSGLRMILKESSISIKGLKRGNTKEREVKGSDERDWGRNRREREEERIRETIKLQNFQKKVYEVHLVTLSRVLNSGCVFFITLTSRNFALTPSFSLELWLLAHCKATDGCGLYPCPLITNSFVRPYTGFVVDARYGHWQNDLVISYAALHEATARLLGMKSKLNLCTNMVFYRRKRKKYECKQWIWKHWCISSDTYFSLKCFNNQLNLATCVFNNNIIGFDWLNQESPRLYLFIACSLAFFSPLRRLILEKV